MTANGAVHVRSRSGQGPWPGATLGVNAEVAGRAFGQVQEAADGAERVCEGHDGAAVKDAAQNAAESVLQNVKNSAKAFFSRISNSFKKMLS